MTLGLLKIVFLMSARPLCFFLMGLFFVRPLLGKDGPKLMGPLLIKSPEVEFAIEPGAPFMDWQEFSRKVRLAKDLGVKAISTDIWWGLVQRRGEGQFDWAYYHKMAQIIVKEHGLRWMPILSKHQLGGNVGDKGFIALPFWLEEKLKGQNPWYVSEFGNISKESLSVWVTPKVLPYYRNFLVSFLNEFKDYAPFIEEINLSLGPAGELRYPSYNAHDGSLSGYPHRGALQAYSGAAVESFRAWVEAKYQSIGRLNKAWGFALKSFAEVYPPEAGKVEEFYRKGEHFKPYGQDFFDWYNESLLQHGALILQMAERALENQSEFRSTALGAKIPGVHWRMKTDRLAELPAGLIRTSFNNWMSSEVDYGYYHILELFKKNPRVRLHFTALEMDDLEGGEGVGSLAKSLVFWMAQGAKKRGVLIWGENALGFTLFNKRGWQNILDALIWGPYQGVTLLRLDELMENELAREELRALSEKVQKL